MAQNQAAVLVDKDDWYQLTNADATAISFQIVTDEEWRNGIFVRVTDDATKPTAEYGFRYGPKSDLTYNLTLLSLRAGAGAPKRVWAKALRDAVVVIVSDNSL